MIRVLVFSIFMMVSGVASAVQYNCNASLSQVPSVIWNAGYFIQIRQGLGNNVVGQVRINRNVSSGLPRAELIQLQCAPGSDGAEFDCIERFTGVRRGELLAGQFFPNGWATLYGSPSDQWQPFFIGNAACNRMF